MAKIENHQYTIEEAFRECFYRVPDYQREYVWTDKEVVQLLEDIDEQVDSDTTNQYFIGMALVSSEERGHYDVIDGQQRLTTLFLLLCALRHLFRGEPQEEVLSRLISTSYTSTDGETRTSLKLEPRYENADEIVSKIAELNADPEETRRGVEAAGISSFGSLEKLLNAYATVFRYLQDNYDDASKLKKYWGYLANKVVFIQISTDVSNALKIFETINERGVGLNSMDLLKNLLFTNVQAKEFNRLKNEWKQVTKPLEQAKQKPLRFLRYFLMANYSIENRRGDGVVREDEIYDWLTNRDNAALCGYREKPFDFVRKIIRSVEQYLSYINGNGNDSKSNLAMDHLKRLTGGAFSLHYILLLAASPFPKQMFDHFITQLESFLFYYIFTKTPTRELERNFSAWAEEVRQISQLGDSPEQRIKLNAFVSERFKKHMADKEGELADALKRYEIDSMQRYRTRYLLAKLTQFVDMSYRGLNTPGSLDEYFNLDIEHILPMNPTEELRKSFKEKTPEALYALSRDMLGNLTLLEKPINVVASNDFFDEKKAEYAKSKHYLTSSISGLTTVGDNTSINRINKHLLAFEDWTAKSIEQRQAMLIELAKDVWKSNPIEVG